MHSNIQYDFQYGERHSYQVFSANDIELKAEERVGIYSWHMRVPPKGKKAEDIKAFCNVMSSKSYDISMRSNLQDHFSGQATKKTVSVEIEHESNIFLSRVTAILCPPVYIGISNNVKSRLICHKRALISYLDRYSQLRPTSGKEDPHTAPEDSDAESSKFGERVGRVLAEAGIETENSLFIKAIYFDNISREELRQCESFVNRNFHPLFGIR